ncbi:hypothetical protein [Pseudobacteroides cellulosolvens]|uniref:Uncharacterized protein n=1 Tax=Pseudobacteroides cellulosolvens ATCC 35603 = DSM 2933 TaxID=398512 RepID=A0A0L6JUT1_9FIRM|nr:hypothetical protein [Pseudobacteroides cellulosolvens]KNY29616.1 hypothetical protein Bccel_4890 [Pseudobacteroides cellulosolvens ATCC 35603 = DSM 2933]
MNTEVIRPGKVFYLISGAVFIIGIILFVVLLLTGITSTVNRLDTRIVVPGTNTIELKETGKYSIYFEYRSVLDGKVYETESIVGLMCSLKNTETGESVNLSNSIANSNYSISGRQGKSIFDFDIDKPGKYEFKAWYKSERGEEAVLAIGKGFGGSLVRTILLCIGALIISLGASITIFVVTLVRRNRAKKSMQMNNLL